MSSAPRNSHRRSRKDGASETLYLAERLPARRGPGRRSSTVATSPVARQRQGRRTRARRPAELRARSATAGPTRAGVQTVASEPGHYTHRLLPLGRRFLDQVSHRKDAALIGSPVWCLAEKRVGVRQQQSDERLRDNSAAYGPKTDRRTVFLELLLRFGQHVKPQRRVADKFFSSVLDVHEPRIARVTLFSGF